MRTGFRAIAAICAGSLAATCPVTPAWAAPGASAPAHPRHYTYARHYVNGQVLRYTYTEAEAGTALTAVARLTSFVRRGTGGERVKWVALYSDGQDLSARARAFPAYDLSLDPRDPAGLALPDTREAGQLQAPVDDLLTFYVGLSDDVGIDRVHQPGQSYLDPALLAGDFSSATTPVGRDLLQLTTTLTGVGTRRATFTSSFQPPPQGGLTLYRPWMTSPVCGTVPDNFELVQAAGTQYVALWGCESFTVTTVVSRPLGQIVSVRMTNTLRLSGALCQDAALTTCVPVSPAPVLRTVRLVRDQPAPEPASTDTPPPPRSRPTASPPSASPPDTVSHSLKNSP